MIKLCLFSPTTAVYTPAANVCVRLLFCWKTGFTVHLFCIIVQNTPVGIVGQVCHWIFTSKSTNHRAEKFSQYTVGAVVVLGRVLIRGGGAGQGNHKTVFLVQALAC